MENIKKRILKNAPILKEYLINEDTTIIIPAKEIHYDSIVMERKNIYLIRQTPQNIIKQNMRHHGFDFNSGRKSYGLYLDYTYKSPVSLSDEKLLIAFPTRGIKHPECAWIIERNVKDIQHHNDGSAFTFLDGTIVRLDISENIAKNQCKKAKELNNFLFMNFLKLKQRFKTGNEGYR